MKKLLIAFAAVAVATGVQAAAVTWQWAGSVNNGYLNSGASSTSYEGKAAQAGTMYIFNANSSGVSQAAVLSAVLAGGDYAALSMDSYTTANGQMGSTAKKTLEANYTDFSPVRTSGGKDYADFFYAMVVDDNVFISDTFSSQIQTAKDTSLSGGTIAVQSAKFQGLGSDGFTAGGWYSTSSAVPEPTSGLLLILGVAGLALRRKQA